MCQGERVKIAIWMSGGCIDGIRSSHANVDVKIYDSDDIREGAADRDDDPDATESIAEDEYDQLPNGVY